MDKKQARVGGLKIHLFVGYIGRKIDSLGIAYIGRQQQQRWVPWLAGWLANGYLPERFWLASDPQRPRPLYSLTPSFIKNRI